MTPKTPFFTDNWHFNIFYALLLIGMATLPFTNWFMLPIAIAMFINWIIEWNWREKWLNIRERNALPGTIIAMSAFLMPILGLIISTNKAHALPSIDCSIWFLAAPLMMPTYSREYLTRNRIHKALFIFAISTFIEIGLLTIISGLKFYITGSNYYFYYHFFSIFRHPSYLAMYVTFSFFLFLYYIFHNHDKPSFWRTLALFFSLIILIGSLICLQSKAGLFTFFILLFIWIIYLIYTKRIRIIGSILLFCFILGCGYVIFKTDLLPRNRVKHTLEQVKNHKNNPNGKSSSEIRLTLWKTSWTIAKKNLPWGVGNGNASDKILQHAVENNYTNLIGHNYNAHNQYLQTLLSTGILGFLILMTFCLAPFYYGIKHHNILYVSFAIVLILNIFVESMFEARAGVNFIAIMNMLLYLRAVEPQNSQLP